MQSLAVAEAADWSDVDYQMLHHQLLPSPLRPGKHPAAALIQQHQAGGGGAERPHQKFELSLDQDTNFTFSIT